MPSIPKEKRLECKENLERVRRLHCCVCFAPRVDVHHFKSRKSGGGDNLGNLMPLCRTHHTEIHTIGRWSFLEKYDGKDKGCQITKSRQRAKLPPLGSKL
jgi:hypothetical protein